MLTKTGNSRFESKSTLSSIYGIQKTPPAFANGA
jgi:hypothetical protein